MKSDLTRKIDELIKAYNSIIKVVDNNANEEEDRAYGGIVRSVKGRLQEHITEEIVNMAWESIGGKNEHLSIDSKKQKIPIQKDYIMQIEDDEVKQYILSNVSDYFFGLSVDKQVYIDKKLVIGIECKAYTENAMIKRILVDFSLLKTIFPNISCYLFQLESQLGGDYCDLSEISFEGHGTTLKILATTDKLTWNVELKSPTINQQTQIKFQSKAKVNPDRMGKIKTELTLKKALSWL